MAFPQVYLTLPGTAREALNRYQEIFGGEVGVNTFQEFGREDGPADAIAHGMLRGDVTLFASDAGDDGTPLRAEGLMLTIFGEDAARCRAWFQGLSEGGTVLDDLQRRPWGDFDGTVRDRYGVTWLIGFTGATGGAEQSET